MKTILASKIYRVMFPISNTNYFFIYFFNVMSFLNTEYVNIMNFHIGHDFMYFEVVVRSLNIESSYY